MVEGLIAGRFRLTRKLARGGSADVFAAVDQSTGQRVALKRILAGEGKHGAVARFMREYYALSELRHPRIIAVYDYGVEHGDPLKASEHGSSWQVEWVAVPLEGLAANVPETLLVGGGHSLRQCAEDTPS